VGFAHTVIAVEVVASKGSRFAHRPTAAAAAVAVARDWLLLQRSEIVLSEERDLMESPQGHSLDSSGSQLADSWYQVWAEGSGLVASAHGSGNNMGSLSCWHMAYWNL